MRVQRQLLGVARAEDARDALDVLVRLGCRSAWVVHGEDGLDEVSTAAPTRVLSYHAGEIESFRIEPGQHVARARSEDLAGGAVEENAAIARAILGGEKGPRRDVVVVNAAAALCAARHCGELGEAVAAAEASLDTGAAQGALERWVEFVAGGPAR